MSIASDRDYLTDPRTLDPAVVMSLALDSDDQGAMTVVGAPWIRLLQHAVHLARDPAIASQYPELVARMHQRMEAGRRRRPRLPDGRH